MKRDRILRVPCLAEYRRSLDLRLELLDDRLHLRLTTRLRKCSLQPSPHSPALRSSETVYSNSLPQRQLLLMNENPARSFWPVLSLHPSDVWLPSSARFQRSLHPSTLRSNATSVHRKWT